MVGAGGDGTSTGCLATALSLLDDAALDSDPDVRNTARACRERAAQYLAGGPEAGDFDQVFEGPLAEARAAVAARYDAAVLVRSVLSLASEDALPTGVERVLRRYSAAETESVTALAAEVWAARE